MPSIGQENLETVMIDFLGAIRRGDFEAAAGLLDPDVSWQGLREEWVCHGREEVVDTFRWGLELTAWGRPKGLPTASAGCQPRVWRRIQASATGAARGSVGGESKSPCPAPGKTMIVQSLPPSRLIE